MPCILTDEELARAGDMTDSRIHELVAKGLDVYILSPQAPRDVFLIEVCNQSTRTRARKLFDGSLAGMMSALEQCVSEARPWDHDGPVNEKPVAVQEEDEENPFG